MGVSRPCDVYDWGSGHGEFVTDPPLGPRINCAFSLLCGAHGNGGRGHNELVTCPPPIVPRIDFVFSCMCDVMQGVYAM